MSRLPPLPDTWPGKLAGYENIFVAPVLPDTAEDIRLRIAMFDRRPAEMKIWARKVVEAFGLPRHCPRPPCRRAGEYRSEHVACFIEQREGIREALAQMAADRGTG